VEASAMPFPRFAVAPAGSIASQAMSRRDKKVRELEEALEEKTREIARLRAQILTLENDSDASSSDSEEGYQTVKIPLPPHRPFRCSFCKEWGHTVDQCVPRFIDNIEHMHTHCCNHVHSPYQHDREWRCNWCGKHLCEEEVKSFPGWERRVRNPTPEWDKDPKGKGKGKGKGKY